MGDFLVVGVGVFGEERGTSGWDFLHQENTRFWSSKFYQAKKIRNGDLQKRNSENRLLIQPNENSKREGGDLAEKEVPNKKQTGPKDIKKHKAKQQASQKKENKLKKRTNFHPFSLLCRTALAAFRCPWFMLRKGRCEFPRPVGLGTVSGFQRVGPAFGRSFGVIR